MNMRSYRRDIQEAYRRLTTGERRHLESERFGTIEYTQWGEGPALLFSHALFGGFDVGIRIAKTYIGSGYRFVVPSRFGYLGSSLPPGATPAAQADAYAFLLGALGIEQAAIFGYSAGGTSAIQFALRHPGRTMALILLASALPGKAGRPPRPVAQLLFGSDVLFWALPTYTPRLLARILGMPKNSRPTPGQLAAVVEAGESLLPVRPRKQGVLFDLYVSTPDVQHYPLAEISVPTLIMNAKDDGLSAFTNAARAAQHIKAAKFIPIEQGGHLLLGSERRIQQETTAFIKAAAAP
jgi:pimeloyl-ACP methyl ester carboxylesterase